jgi:hypothetical protein
LSSCIIGSFSRRAQLQGSLSEWVCFIWKIISSELLRRVVRWKPADVSEKHIITLFMVEK